MSDVSIKYKGSEISGMSGTGNRTLKTKGKYCEDDIRIDYTRPQTGGDAPSGTIDITTNGTKDVAAYAEANVQVPPSAVVSGTLDIDRNGETDVAEYARVNVQVTAGTSDATATPDKILNPYTAYTAAGKVTGTLPTRNTDDLTVSGRVVSVTNAGYFPQGIQKAVAQGTAGVPTFAQESGSHSLTLTPQVTNSTGYITGNTRLGTPVTVSAADLVEPQSNPLQITGDGDYDVTNYSKAHVATGGGGGGVDPSDATATAADILSPKTAYTASGKVTGTLPTRSVSNMSVSGATVSIGDAGYYPAGVSKTVPSGTKGTPELTVMTMSKALAPSGHKTIAVTPKVKDGEGYIEGDANYRNGSTQSYTAADFAEDTLDISAPGTFDVTYLAAVRVLASAISPAAVTANLEAVSISKKTSATEIKKLTGLPAGTYNIYGFFVAAGTSSSFAAYLYANGTQKVSGAFSTVGSSSIAVLSKEGVAVTAGQSIAAYGKTADTTFSYVCNVALIAVKTA